MQIYDIGVTPAPLYNSVLELRIFKNAFTLNWVMTNDPFQLGTWNLVQ